MLFGKEMCVWLFEGKKMKINASSQLVNLVIVWTVKMIAVDKSSLLKLIFDRTASSFYQLLLQAVRQNWPFEVQRTVVRIRFS